MGRDSSLSRGHGLGAVRTLAQFRDFADDQPALSAADRALLVGQARILLESLYVHLPLKAAMHAVDPVQRLRLLAFRAATLTDREFQAELLDIFLSLRDLHTNYSLPEPYSSRIAFLGVLVERYHADGRTRWMVSKVFDHLVTDPTLQAGVELTHWNGAPLELAVWRNAQKEAGSNLAARVARGLESLSLRFLGGSLPPDEDWVDVRYLVGPEAHETRLVWRVFDSVQEIVDPQAAPSGLVAAPLAHVVGVDLRTELIRRVKKQLFAPAAVREERRVARSRAAVPKATSDQAAAGIISTSRPDDLLARIVTTAHGSYGYLRLFTFHMKDGKIDDFVAEVSRLLEEEFPPEGLIVDVRGNGGGYIIAAEYLLQLLTPRRVEPEPTQFVNRPATLELVTAVADMADWRPSIEQAIQTGAQYSAGIPLSPAEVVNSAGQLYHGPVVLITDAFCYSACDMFAAGFADHGIGTVLGVDASTGAGGANVVEHQDLATDWVGGPLRPLPAGAAMRVALRRTLRVGAAAGQPVEDLGVVPDHRHDITRADLLEGNRDLIEHAGELLAAGTPRTLKVEVVSVTGVDVQLAVTTRNVPALDLYVDGRPAGPAGVSTPDGTTVLPVTLATAGRGVLRLDGFSGDELVASRLVTIPAD